MRDKPGKPPDFYHTCYCLSGLSAAQHASNCVLGPRENLLKRADAMVNVAEERLETARRWAVEGGWGRLKAVKSGWKQLRQSGAVVGNSWSTWWESG